MKTILHIVIGIVIGVLIGVGAWMVTRSSQVESVALSSLPPPETIQVNVIGAVVHPGLYELDENSRIADAVEAAGGYLDQANDQTLNLAARVENAQIVDVPYKMGIVPDVQRGNAIVPEVISSSNSESELANNNSVVQEEFKIQPEVTPTPTAPITTTASCADASAFVWPADNHSLSGNEYSSDHPGIDIAAGEGSPVYAANSGIVMAMGNDTINGYGNMIQIDHGNGYFTLYAHLSKIGVSMLQCVHAGQQIGTAGNTGNSRGTHLHFEIIQDGWYINPWPVLP